MWRFSQTNITELQRVVNMCEARTTELDNSLPSLTEKYENKIKQLEQQFLSQQKELAEVHTGLQKDKNSEIWNLKKRNEHLERMCLECKSRLSEKESKSKELTRKLGETRDDLQYYLSRLSHEEANTKTFQEECAYYKYSFQQLRTDFNACVKDNEAQIKQMKDRMSRKDDELEKVREELKDKTERLASIFQRRLKQDQRKVENAVEFNTPSDVEKDFKYFFDGPRIDACETMENTLSSTTYIDTQIRYLACIIFVTAYEQVEEAREAANDFFNNITKQLIDEAPRKSQELCIKRKEEGCSSTFPVMLEVSVERKEIEDTRDIVDGLMLSLKQTAHLCDLTCFEKDVKQVISGRWTKCLQEEQEMPLLPPFSEEVITEVDDYIKACVRLSWKIVTQVPPLRLEYSSSKFNKRIHSRTRLYYNNERSEQGQSENIACYLWPALVEHGGKVIFPGEVLCY